MKRTSLLAAITASFLVGATAAAFAATVEYDFTVPITIKGGTTQHSLATASVAVACAVGGTNLGYSTATGDAANSTGEGRTTVASQGNVAQLTGNAKVVVTDAGGVATQYLCFAKLSDGSTPVNFVHGTIKKGTGAMAGDSWTTP
jgi:hypothetical protein